MKNISILGSTGSIGRQTLEVAAANPEKLKVRALAAHKSDELLEQQIKQFEPDIAVLTDKDAAKRLADRYHGKTEILAGEEGLLAAATYEGADTVLGSRASAQALPPSRAAMTWPSPTRKALSPAAISSPRPWRSTASSCCLWTVSTALFSNLCAAVQKRKSSA